MKIAGKRIQRNFNYMAREEYEKRLQRDIEQNHLAILKGATLKGKTELAKAFYFNQINKKEEKVCIWLSCETKNSLVESTTLLTSQLGIAPGTTFDQTIKHIKDYLEANQNWLLVIDGLTYKHSFLLEEILPLAGNGDIIITTSMSGLPPEFPDAIQVGNLDKADAIKYLQNKLHNRTQSVEDDTKSLLECTEYQPFLFYRAVSFIRHKNNLTIQEYISLHKSNSALLTSAAGTFENLLSIRLLRQLAENEEPSRLAFMLLTMCAYLDGNYISAAHIKAFVKKSLEYSTRYKEIKTLHTDTVGCVDKALILLQENGFIELDGEEPSTQKDKLIINESVQKLLRDQISFAEKQNSLGDAYAFIKTESSQFKPFIWLRKIFAQDQPELKAAEISSFHAATIYQGYQNTENFPAIMAIDFILDMAELFNSLGRYQMLVNNYPLAQLYLRTAKKMIEEKVLSEKAYQAIGHLASSKEENQSKARSDIKSNVTCQRIYDLYATEILHNLGTVNLNFSENNPQVLADALKVLKYAVKLQAHFLGQSQSEDPHLFFTRRTLARAHRDKGRAEKEKAELEKALQLFKQLTQHASFKRQLGLKQAVLMDIGVTGMYLENIKPTIDKKNYDSAINDLQDALKVFEDPNYPSKTKENDKAIVLIRLGEAYLMAKRYPEAEKNLLLAYDNNQALTPPKTQLTSNQRNARIYHLLARVYAEYEPKLYGLALKLAKLALVMQTKLYYLSHYYVLEAKALYEELQKKVDGASLMYAEGPKEPTPEEQTKLRRFNELIQKQENVIQALEGRAQFYIKHNLFSQAAQDFEEVKKMKEAYFSQSFPLEEGYLQSLCGLNRHSEVVAEFKKTPVRLCFFTERKQIYDEAIKGKIKHKFKQKSESQPSQLLFQKQQGFIVKLLQAISLHSTHHLADRGFSKRQMASYLVSAFSKLLPTEVTVQVLGCGGGVKAEVGQAIAAFANLPAAIEEKERQMRADKRKEFESHISTLMLSLSIRLALEFSEQLSWLKVAGGIDVLADYMATQLLEYIEKGHVTQLIPDKIMEQFIEGIYQSKRGKAKRLATEDGINKLLTTKGLFTASGIKVNNTYYTQQDKQLDEHDVYGFRDCKTVDFTYIPFLYDSYNELKLATAALEDFRAKPDHRCALM